MKKLLLLAVILAASSRLMAQGIALSADYDVPEKNLKYIYNAAPAYSVSFLKYYDKVTLNLTVGHRAFQPKQETFYWIIDEQFHGTESYTAFSSVMAYFGVSYNMRLSDRCTFLAGANAGIYMSKYNYSFRDNFVHYDLVNEEQELYIAPKAGLGFAVTNKLRLELQSKFNVFSPTGEKRTDSRVGTVYSSWSAGLGLSFNFSRNNEGNSIPVF